MTLFIILARPSIIVLTNRALETPPLAYQLTDAWQTLKVVFQLWFSHHDGENKAVFDSGVIQPFCYNLTLAMVSWWMPVSESSTNPRQKRKKQMDPVLLTPRHGLILRDPELVQTWAETLLV